MLFNAWRGLRKDIKSDTMQVPRPEGPTERISAKFIPPQINRCLPVEELPPLSIGREWRDQSCRERLMWDEMDETSFVRWDHDEMRIWDKVRWQDPFFIKWPFLSHKVKYFKLIHKLYYVSINRSWGSFYSLSLFLLNFIWFHI